MGGRLRGGWRRRITDRLFRQLYGHVGRYNAVAELAFLPVGRPPPIRRDVAKVLIVRTYRDVVNIATKLKITTRN